MEKFVPNVNLVGKCRFYILSKSHQKEVTRFKNFVMEEKLNEFIIVTLEVDVYLPMDYIQ